MGRSSRAPLLLAEGGVDLRGGRRDELLVGLAVTEVDAAVDGLTSIIEPILIIVLAVVVGTIVIAMFMPLVSIISNLK